MSPPAPRNPFESTEAYYAAYRPRYGDETIDYLRERFDLDDSARVLDLGCGAGQLAVPLAAHVGDLVGMDPNEEMLRHARRVAEEDGIENVHWVVGSDADLDGFDDTTGFRLTTMGRSFHWMNQERTLDHLSELTEPGGGVALLTDHEWLTKGTDSWQAVVYDTIAGYVDDLPERVDPAAVEYDDPWDELFTERGFSSVETRTIPVERVWDADSIVGYVFSLSFVSPATLGEDQEALESDLQSTVTALDDERFVQEANIEVVSGKK